jgi:CSLREA domain-containing protein
LTASAAIAFAVFAGPAGATTFTVNETSDEPDATLNGSCDTDVGTSGLQCTLRAAIQEANSASGNDDIHFGVETTSLVTIAPLTKLPAITSPVTIDGSTQPSLLFERPRVELAATDEAGGDGLQFLAGSGGSALEGLIVNRSPGYGLRIAAPVTLSGNWIGTDSTGDGAAANALGGVLVTTGGAQSLLGVPGELPNVISGNGGPGIEVDAGPVTIQNNLVGTNPSGRSPVANAGAGINVADGATGDVIGGATGDDANVIGGNTGGGVVVDGSTGIQITGNLIGVAVANGDYAVGNAGHGISLANAPNAQIGPTGSGERNVISANAGTGVVVGAGSTNSSVDGNYIGLRPDGTAIGAGGLETFGNGGDGVDIQASGAAVGTARQNVISGQLGAGIRIGAPGAMVRNNRIGTDPTGQTYAGNGLQGIVVESVVGGEIGAPGAGNIVAANADSQLRLDGATGVVVQGNAFGPGGPLLAGVNVGGTSPAVALAGGTSGTVIGGTGPGAGNVIMGQQGVGPGIGTFGSAGTGNSIRGNSLLLNGGIGIDLGGDGITPNDGDDSDVGWNALQNYPVITNAVRSDTTVRLDGYLQTAPGVASYQLDFFLSSSCDESGNGEGALYVTSRSVQTNGAGLASFAFDLPATGTTLTSIVTATATSTGGDTSEFSKCSQSPYTGTLELQPPEMSGREPSGGIALLVERRYGTAGTISVDYSTSDGTATAPADYQATSGTVVFGPGETEKQLVIPIVDDRSYEGDETFNVTLSNPVLTAIPGPRTTSVVTIIDNDPFRPEAQAVLDVKIGGSSTPKKAAAKCKVPKLKGLTKKKAQAKLKKAKCKLGKVRKTKKKVKSKKLRNRVVTQKPKAGKKVKRGTKVSLTLGRR